jgi:predicted TIM-barrel fold metal-dependent hydrolase
MIDFHTHLHPPRLFAAIRRWFAERSDWKIEDQPSEPHAVARALAEAGVERFVFFSYAHRPGMAREINAWLAQTARDLGGAGVPLGTIHLDDPAYLEDLALALEAGCAGIKIHEDVQQLALDDPRFDPAYATIAARKGVIVVHVGPIPWRNEPGGPARVESVLRRHPDLNVIVAHMGVPDTADYFGLIERYPRLYLDTTMIFAAGSPLGTAIAPADTARTAARILYGTDFPNTPYPYRRERDGLEALGLEPAALDAILRGNAAHLLDEFERSRNPV